MLVATQDHDPNVDWKYAPQLAMVIARIITKINSRVTAEGAAFGQQYIFQKGLKKFGRKRGGAAALKEVDQLHKQHCFTPMDVSTLTVLEKKQAQEALLFLTEKRSGKIKGRLVFNGKPTREWLSREDSASPTRIYYANSNR